MSERRFTRLKASLSETAAKTRESVSRQLRLSLVEATDGQPDPNRSLEPQEHVDEELELFLRERFGPIEDEDAEDIVAEEEAPDDNYQEQEEPKSSLAAAALRHLCQRERRAVFRSKKFFGSVFECCKVPPLPAQDDHVFAIDSRADEKRLLRESACVVNRLTGHVTLHAHHDACFLAFFRDRKRQQLVYAAEVTTAAVRAGERALRLDDNLLEFGSEEDAEEWLKEIESARFDSRQRADQIRDRLTRLTTDEVTQDQEEPESGENLFADLTDLWQRRGALASLREETGAEAEAHSWMVGVTVERLEVDKARLHELWSRLSLFDSSRGRLSEEARFGPSDSDRSFRFLVDARADPSRLFLVLRLDRRPCARSAHFEPFLLSLRPLFTPDGQHLDADSPFQVFVRLQSQNANDDHVMHACQTWTTTKSQASAKVMVRVSRESSGREVASLEPEWAPVSQVTHALYVHAQSLRFSEQKIFSKARNLCLELCVKDSDSRDAQPLLVLADGYMWAESGVVRHQTSPEFGDEVKIRLPLATDVERLHVLFRIQHVSCKPNACLKTCVGYAWLPLRGHVHGMHTLPVYASLPDRYLSVQPLGLGKDVKIVGRDLLRVRTTLVSSLMARDPTLNTTLEALTTLTSLAAADTATPLSSSLVTSERLLRKLLKSLVTRDLLELVRFSHVLLRQLLLLVAVGSAEDLRDQSVRTVFELLERLADHEAVFHRFVRDHFFFGPDFHLTMLATLNRVLDFWPIDEQDSRLFLRHLWFVLRVHINSCLDHCLTQDKLHVPRDQRFPATFNEHVLRLMSRVSQVVLSQSRADEAQLGNRALAHYITRLLSFCDRSLVFSALAQHVAALSSRDLVIAELRVTSLAVVSAHERLLSISGLEPEVVDLELSSDFRRRHFLVYMLLTEVKHSLAQSVRHTRQHVLLIVRNLLAKLSLDPRHAPRHVTALFFPLVAIVADNFLKMAPEKSWDARPRTEVNHSRHHSLPVRLDAFGADETRDAIACLTFLLSHVIGADVCRLSSDLVQQCLHVLEKGVRVFEWHEHESERARTLPAGADVTQMASSMVYGRHLAVKIGGVALRFARLALSHEARDALSGRVLALLLTLLSTNQSQEVLRDTFDLLQTMSARFPDLVFGSALFSPLVQRLVELCDSALKPVRAGAVDLLFGLFLINFKRTRFETIVCVSRLASEDRGGARPLTRFEDSLTRLELLSADERRVRQTVQRVKDILKATQRIRSEARNQYESCELRLFLANSYAQTALRRTWLENLADSHKQHEDWPEFAMCLSHVIAIVVNDLRLRGHRDLDGARHLLARVSPNLTDFLGLETDDEEPREDSDRPTSHVVASLLQLVDDCAEALHKSQLFELSAHVLRIPLELLESQRAHQQLVQTYSRLSLAHSRALELNQSGKRLFDTYFRVAFCTCGHVADEFVYRERKVCSLAEMTAKLRNLHPKAIVGDQEDASIRVTHVTPVSDAEDEFGRNVGVTRFQYEQRIGSERDVGEQRKRRVTLRTQHALPFCLKRVPVIDRSETVLEPIEVAIDEMAARVRQLRKVVEARDAKHLQLVLQGSVQATVNAGPVQYLTAFLKEGRGQDEQRAALCDLFQQFVELCEEALRLNERLIKADQTEYHASLQDSFAQLRAQLALPTEPKRTSVQIFDVISGASLA